MPRPRFALFAAAALVLIAPAAAHALVGGDANPSGAPLTTTWYVAADPAAQAADRAYVAGMRPHHAGALSMSREYLADPERRSPLVQALARAIIANQAFEIGVLDAVTANLDRPAIRLPFGMSLQPVATEGMGDAQRFFRAPVPSAAAWPVSPMSGRDVLFAKAMILHHEAALEMAGAYHANPAARNGFLGLMNVDILADQTQEIALMRWAIAAYAGDPDRIVVDPSMVHGMEGMRHAGHGGPALAPDAALPGPEVAPAAPVRAAPVRRTATPKPHRSATIPAAAAPADGHAGHHDH
jgi:uncharacterized protein (DUF305 family)